jgi:3-oxoacyl-[acyl-carrier-protein] synthase III
MAALTIPSLAIKGVVCAVPGSPLTLKDLLGSAAADPEVVERLTTMGIRQIYRTRPGQTTADLCSAAAKRLLAQLDWGPATVDGLIVVTQTPDYFLPNTASVLHADLGLSNHAFAFDVGMGCSGFIYGLWMASQFIHCRSARRVLLLVGDTLSQAADKDPSGMLIGDGAAAFALEWSAAAPPTTFVLHSDGNGYPNLILRGGAFRAAGAPKDEIYHNGWGLFTFSVSEVPGLVDETLTAHGWSPDDVDCFLLHQANRVILQHLGTACDIPKEKLPINVERFGNTSGVSIPLLIADAIADAVTATSLNVLLASYGVGYAWAGCATTLGPLRVAEVLPVAPDYRVTPPEAQP